MKTHLLSFLIVFVLSQVALAVEYHVSPNGDDSNSGTVNSPFRTIQKAAELARAGDVVTVHEGIYRERVNPLHGGKSNTNRIVYQAAPREKVEIKGSEILKNWVKLENDTWKATVPNSVFGDFNPFGDTIRGDWFDPKKRSHHTGAVYLNGEWLIEAASLEEVMKPFGSVEKYFERGSDQYLLNVAWFRLGEAGENVAATGFSAKEGTRNADCEEGGDCVGWISPMHWLRYDDVDFGEQTDRIDFRAAAASSGGVIEIRLDGPSGDLLGSCTVPFTGGWQNWKTFPTKIKPVSGKKNLCLVFRRPQERSDVSGLWFAKVDEAETTIWAQFKDVDPNKELVEINVRRSVFYPEQPGVNFITVRGFTMRHAATPWAPPTAEQIGLIGTHWSKGWIIENNVISHSVCTGVTLGKYGDEFDNTSANSAEGYVETINRAHQFRIPWEKEHIGGHVVRNNVISHCEQAGIVGSMGAAFSSVTGNVIHDIHVRRLFGGAEMAGIKFHGAIDTEIARNNIYRTCLALWLDWMTQGTRVTRNLFHDNDRDFFVEVSHGPFLVDNNVFLSRGSVLTYSRGGAFVHNLFTGSIDVIRHDARLTPFHKPHSTEVLGLHDNPSGDDRYYNNVFYGQSGLLGYDNAQLPVKMDGNVFLGGAKPSKFESGADVSDVPLENLVPERIREEIFLDIDEKAIYIVFNEDKCCKPVTTELLGITAIAKTRFDNPDGSLLSIDTDYFGQPRDKNNPKPGPFESVEGKTVKLGDTKEK